MTPRPIGDTAQREIIRTHLDVSLIVEASAGTGKTTELVNRIVAPFGQCDYREVRGPYKLEALNQVRSMP